MGTDLHGYIEVKRWDNDFYRGIVDAGLIESRSYIIYSKLFGVRDQWDYIPIAADRGLPVDCSEQVKDTFYYKEDRDEPTGHHFSWVGWEEIRNKISYLLKDIESGALANWQLMFKIMADLAEVYGDRNVRLVVRFS